MAEGEEEEEEDFDFDFGFDFDLVSFFFFSFFFLSPLPAASSTSSFDNQTTAPCFPLPSHLVALSFNTLCFLVFPCCDIGFNIF